MSDRARMYFQKVTDSAHQLEKLEAAGDAKAIEELDKKLVTTISCTNCQRILEPPIKTLRCSVCKAVLYCSKECSLHAWKFGMSHNAPNHKQLCPDNKRHMERLPLTHAVLKSFPWGKLGNDGTFSDEFARGRFDVLGATGYGYWSHRGGPVPHQFQGPTAGMASNPLLAEISKAFYHLDGHDLIHEKEHLSDEKGWKLRSDLIPYREFSGAGAQKIPVLVTESKAEVTDWDSWYTWRKLPKASPAALLMHFPLSVYQLVVKCLKLTNPSAGSSQRRVALQVHLVGAEVELNFLPLFSELALLLPYHDIKLVLFGHGVQNVIKEAQKLSTSNRLSPLVKALGTSPRASTSHVTVFKYTAPEALGAGTITIDLYAESGEWDIDSVRKYGSELKPDALIACNAGLGSYPSWFKVIRDAFANRIPFAVTEYSEQSVEHQVRILFPMLMPPNTYASDLNPFHRPGQRAVSGFLMPNLVNGFTIVVVKGK